MKKTILKLFLRLTLVLAGLLMLLLLCQLLLERDEALDSSLMDQAPTTRVTVEDVIAADIKMPVRSRVSLPQWSYRQAFPEATDEPEIEISSFQQAPMLEDLDSMPEAWRPFFPESLPPVEERLPRNPAVVEGPDGTGEYGGIWRRATTMTGDITSKIGYESFIRFDPKGRIQPGLAYKWDVSEDKRVYTFYLRKGHKWSDGAPFTSHDILWVCNHLIGSPRWPSTPNWMQGTDGSLALYVKDSENWQAVAIRILEQNKSDTPSPGKQLIKNGNPGLLKQLEIMAKTPETADAKRLLSGLQEAINQPEFIDLSAWQNVDLEAELNQLREQGVSQLTETGFKRLELLLQRESLLQQLQTEGIGALNDANRKKLGMWLFRAAYADLVHPAVQTRVKIEAVPDEEGDDSHIIRFTFESPNSIFLEKTGTFMFYRGLFATPKHKDQLMHPMGSDQLEITDFIDWPNFAQALQTAGSENPIAAKVWAKLAPKAKTLLSKNAASLNEAQQNQIKDTLNALLTQPDLFSPEDWAPLDLQSEMAALQESPYDLLYKNWDQKTRYRELLIREDLLRRVAQSGVESLDGNDRYRLFQSIFRESLQTGNGSQAPLARNRTEGLNYTAVNHPLKYSSWVVRANKHNKFDPVFNPAPPTLYAWRNISKGEDRTKIAVRNPYYYRVDPEGNQLPYLDAVETQSESDSQVRLLKLRSGNVDFQVRQIEFQDFTVLKQNEKIGGYEIRLWPQDFCGQVTFVPIQANQDEMVRKLNNDPRYRHALSMGLNRQQIIDVIYNGIGKPAQASVPKGSPYYSERHHNMSVEYNPDEANRLLDEMGLDKRGPDGTRLLWNGKPFILSVNTVDSQPLALIQMACQNWRALGINAQMKVQANSSISRLTTIGLIDMVVHVEGGNYFGPLAPGIYAPTHPAECKQWGRWVTNLTSASGSGIWQPPERVRRAADMWEELLRAGTEEEKHAAWQRLSDEAADQLSVIGITSPPGKLVYVRDGFMNVPEIALAGWIAHEPGNSCPEVFWKKKEARP
ncbi:ABC transporter substrate-binding protein [Kiritimatiellaeota bacterium B1221]|nr:ABC transporter substrate-binding protein [Kiritimatiellaeota bacterium B1221]